MHFSLNFHLAIYADLLLDDFLVADNSSYPSDPNSPHIASERSSSPIGSPKGNHSNLSFSPGLDIDSISPSSGGARCFFSTS